MSWDSVVAKAAGYGLDDHVVQTGSGVHQTPYPMGNGVGSFPGGKAAAA
jgi:hypothetical protein